MGEANCRGGGEAQFGLNRAALPRYGRSIRVDCRNKHDGAGDDLVADVNACKEVPDRVLF